MLYIKEADKISDYLKILKANNAVLLLLKIKESTATKKNQANRLNNCEQANMDKVVANRNSPTRRYRHYRKQFRNKAY